MIVIIRCEHCGERYYIPDDATAIVNGCPVLHRVCDTCFMPMAVKNPFQKEDK